MITRYNEASEFYIDEGAFIIELDDPNDSECSIAKARVKAGVTTQWHRLTGTVERYIILEGEGRVEVGDCEPTKVAPLDTVTIPAGVRQRITNTGKMICCFFVSALPGSNLRIMSIWRRK